MILQNPKWLWGIFLVLALWIWIAVSLSGRKKSFSKMIDPVLWQAIAPEWDSSLILRKATIWALAGMMALIAMARPQWGKHEDVVKTSGIDLMVLLDVSRSMMVEDESPSRLKKAKHLIKTLMEGLKGDRVGLIPFAGSALVASPMTTDLGYVGETLEILEPGMIVNQGTDIGLALETATKALDRGAESGKASRAIVLISDGEDHGETAIQAAKQLKEQNIRLYMIGVGTEKGGPIPVRDETGRLVGYKRDLHGQSVVSVFHPESFKKIAEVAAGVYLHATPSENEVEDILKDIGALNAEGTNERKVVTYTDRFQIFLGIAVGLLFLEMSLFGYRRKVKMGIGLVLLGFCSLGFPAASHATVGGYIESKKGIQAYEAGQYEEAQKHFDTAREQDPNDPMTEFNRGTALSKKGDAEGAIESYGKSAEAARAKNQSGLAGRSQFNQGNAYVKKGDTQNAIGSYLKSIDDARKAQDPELEQMARKNLEVLGKQQEQQKKKDQEKKDDQQKDQKQGEQKESGQKDENSKESQQAKKEKEQSQAKDKQDDKSQQKEQQPQEANSQDPKEGQGQGKSKQEFKSDTLSKEDAEKVMQQLSSQQRELQTRLKKQKGQQMNKDKDW